MSSLYQKRGIYYYDGTDLEGNRVQKSLRTRDLAEARREKENLDKKFSQSDVTRDRGLSACIEDYLEKRKRKVDRGQLSERTLSSDKRCLQLFADWVRGEYGRTSIKGVDAPIIRGFKEYRLGDVSPTTTGKNLRHIQSFFSHFLKREEIESSPFKRVEIPESRRRDIIPSQKEFETIKRWLGERINEQEHPDWIHLLMKLSCHTGMRMGEMVRSKWERGPDDFGTGHSRSYIYLDSGDRTLTIKFKSKLRVIPVGHIWGVFERLRERRGQNEEYIFTSPMTGSHYTTSYVCNKWKEEISKCETISRAYTSHSIRHAVVTHLLRKGIPIYKVGKVVGHSSEQITERYSHFIPNDLRDAMSAIS